MKINVRRVIIFILKNIIRVISVGVMGGTCNRDGGAENPYKTFVRKREYRRCVVRH
jgi:hypothetical protein